MWRTAIRLIPNHEEAVKPGPENWFEQGFPTKNASIFPNIVNVEVFRGACPCNCVHCPVGITPPADRAERFGRSGIDLGLYDKITKEVAAYDWSTVRMHSVGEPVLWPDLPEALAIGRRNGVRSWLFTCGVTTEGALLDQLCRDLAVLEVSVNSTGREDYLQTKGADLFDLALDNLRRMSRHRKQGQCARLIVSRTQTTDAVADRAFVDHWKNSGLVDDAFVRSYHTYNGLMSGLDEGSAPGKHQPCLVHWARFNISVQGQAVVCFNELFRESTSACLHHGDVRGQSIREIWQGPKLAALRRAELSGDYSGLPAADALPCRLCTSCQPLKGGRQTSEHQIRSLENPASCRAT